MALRRPTVEDLHRLAAANHFALSPEEVDAYQALLPDMFAALDRLDQAPIQHPPLTYRERDPGNRPNR